MPTLAEVGALIAAFQASVQKAEGGNKQDIAVKNADREALINALHLLGNYVLFTAAGNEVIATSSGFNVSKLPEPRPALTTLKGLKSRTALIKANLN